MFQIQNICQMKQSFTRAKGDWFEYWLLVEDGQLKDVVKDEKGSPEAQIIYNVKLSKEEDWCDVN